MTKTTLATLLAAACLAPALAQAQWKPTKPVTIIVPWAAGGATDQVTRLVGRDDGERPEVFRRQRNEHRAYSG